MSSVIIASGGMDSTTLIYHVREKDLRDHWDEPLIVSFNYGQRHIAELAFCAATCQRLGLEHKVIDIRFLRNHLSGSALTDDTVDVPNGHYAEESMKQTVVPNRNMIMLSIACGIAVANHRQRVWLGVHAGDHFIYPDCRPEFIDSFDKTVQLATEGFAPFGFGIEAPFLHMTKAEIVQRGHELRVPWNETYSCYKGDDYHCGVCGTCTERREAFEIAGIEDPTTYKDPTKHWVSKA